MRRYRIVCEDARHELRASIVGFAAELGVAELAELERAPDALAGYLCAACAAVRDAFRRNVGRTQAEIVAALAGDPQAVALAAEVMATRAAGGIMTRAIVPREV